MTNEAHPQQVKVKVEGHFPFRLYDMLEYATYYEHCSAVSWSDDGRAFTIHQEDKFVEHIVPMFFKQTKFRSFVSPSLSGLNINLVHLMSARLQNKPRLVNSTYGDSNVSHCLVVTAGRMNISFAEIFMGLSPLKELESR
jgi:hypothetical protein